jgi:hypothetical protein
MGDGRALHPGREYMMDGVSPSSVTQAATTPARKAAAALGGYRDPRNARAVNDSYDWERWQRGALQETFSEAISHQRIYLSQRADHRKKWEKTWRAFTLQPYGYVVVEGKTAAISDIINAADPLMGVSGIGDEDVELARRVERLIDTDLRQNQWRMLTENLVREAAYLGTSAIKVTWRNESSKVLDHDPEIEEEFKQFKKAWKAERGESVPESPEEYDEWRQTVMAVDNMVPPAHPGRRVIDVTTFRGPSIDRVSLFDLRFDPMETMWSNQRRVIQRIVKPQKWFMDRAGDDPRLPFDKESVEFAINALPHERFQEWELEQAAMLGLSAAATGYPMSRDLAEAWEVFDPEDEEAPYKIILNRLVLINKDPRGMPYGHGQCPLHLIRNVSQAWTCLGLSELKAPKKLFYELWSLRDLRLDAVTLAVLPVFAKANNLGIPEIAKILRPGKTIPVNRKDDLSKLDLGGVHPDVWREISELKQEIDDSSSVYSNLRGQPASVGRVSASESERRFSSAMLRMKTGAVRFEEDIRGAIRQMVWLRYQNTKPGEMVELAGAPSAEYASINKDQLLEALKKDFNFRGPSQVMNREMLTQQLMQWFGTFGQMIPQHRQLMVAREVWEVMGMRGRDKVLPDSEIQEAQAAAEAAKAAQAQGGAPGAPGAPGMEGAPPAGPPLGSGEILGQQAPPPEEGGTYMAPGEEVLQG